jgi:predicted 2-oxoglutarate/Fe(II)-dependent dioxygenase YbiX
MNQSQFIHHLPGLLNVGAVQAVHQLLEKIPFVDGKTTASSAARDVKRNMQADINNQELMPQLQQIVGMSLMNEPKFQTDYMLPVFIPFFLVVMKPAWVMAGMLIALLWVRHQYALILP